MTEERYIEMLEKSLAYIYGVACDNSLGEFIPERESDIAYYAKRKLLTGNTSMIDFPDRASTQEELDKWEQEL